MGFVLAAYAVSIGAVAVYLGYLVRERRRLHRDLAREPAERA